MCSDPKRTVCGWCKNERSSNVINFKNHIHAKACSFSDHIMITQQTLVGEFSGCLPLACRYNDASVGEGGGVGGGAL